MNIYVKIQFYQTQKDGNQRQAEWVHCDQSLCVVDRWIWRTCHRIHELRCITCIINRPASAQDKERHFLKQRQRLQLCWPHASKNFNFEGGAAFSSPVQTLDDQLQGNRERFLDVHIHVHALEAPTVGPQILLALRSGSLTGFTLNWMVHTGRGVNEPVHHNLDKDNIVLQLALFIHFVLVATDKSSNNIFTSHRQAVAFLQHGMTILGSASIEERFLPFYERKGRSSPVVSFTIFRTK